MDAAAAAGQGKAAIDTGGLVAWQAVLLENWSKIAKHQQKLPARQVMFWLRDNGPRDVFPTEQPFRESLRWIDGYGQAHTLTIKRIGTLLSEWRKKGTIPV